MAQLSEDFLIELAKGCLIDPNFLDVVSPHLKYSFLPSEPYKLVFKYLKEYYDAYRKAPTLGLLTEAVRDKNTLPILGKIREANVYDNREQLVVTFEQFIKAGRFIELHERSAELYNQNQRDEAIKLLAAESQDIHAFSLKTDMLPRVFGDFDARQLQRQNKERLALRKNPIGIPQFDYHSRGGIENGTALLAIARSAGGKTSLLRSIGANWAFRGKNVLHVASGDSTLDEINAGYDAWWTGITINNLREGNMETVDQRKLERAKEQWLSQCGEIYIKVYNQFHSASIDNVRTELIHLLKTVEIGGILFDYADKFKPGDGRRYNASDDGLRLEKMATAEKIVNIATEFDIPVATVTQASNIDREKWNNNQWVMGRENISNLKAMIDPFAYCFTLNQTEDENDQEIMRIHEEKMRHYKIFSHSSTYYIAQDRDRGRFIDVAKTKELYWDEELRRARQLVGTGEVKREEEKKRRPVVRR